MKIKIYTATVVMALLMLASTCNLFAQQRMSDKEVTLHNKAWKSFYAGDYGAAIRASKQYGKSQYSELRYDSLHLQARSLFAQGNKQATSLWLQLNKFKRQSSVAVRMSIAKAINLHAQGKTTQSMPILKKIADNLSMPWMAYEAALEYSEEAFTVNDVTAAIKMLDKVEGGLKSIVSLSDSRKLLYQELIANARNYKPAGAGKKEFDIAVGVYDRKVFTLAIRAFDKVISKYADSEYADQSRLYVGRCMVELKQYSKAEDYLNKLITDDPSGPWR